MGSPPFDMMSPPGGDHPHPVIKRARESTEERTHTSPEVKRSKHSQAELRLVSAATNTQGQGQAAHPSQHHPPHQQEQEQGVAYVKSSPSSVDEGPDGDHYVEVKSQS